LGANNDPINGVFAIGTYHNEIHISGYVSSTANASVRLVDWTRYLTTGAPWVASQPTSQFPACGQNASFTIEAAMGYTDAVYAWRKNGTPLSNGVTANGTMISGANAPTLTLTSVSSADNGGYDCVLSNSCGGETSILATLTVGTTCCADVTHSGAVNIDDLLQVINNWGATGSNPADVTHDGVVDIDDLLSVVNAWGACP
jgi:Immunoglobulin domain